MIKCKLCGNECEIPSQRKGFCGLVENKDGKLVRKISLEKGIVSAYYDPHPTNCVASWICAGGSKHGFPKYSLSTGTEYGYYNLSVFYGACCCDCLFCQNWQWRENTQNLHPLLSSEELANYVNERVSCICFFGGDPAVQAKHAIETAKAAREIKRNLAKAGKCKNILRICFETSGNFSENYLDEVAKISFETGGGIKFDLKAWNENLHIALTGISNKQILRNIKMIKEYHKKRPAVPFIRVSTLLVPGYIDEEEVRKISEYLVEIDPTIPYSLLAFAPDYLMRDLPYTPWKLAYGCKKIAEEVGLKNVRIGNEWLLR